jgi:hypothetical protein
VDVVRAVPDGDGPGVRAVQLPRSSNAEVVYLRMNIDVNTLSSKQATGR